MPVLPSVYGCEFKGGLVARDLFNSASRKSAFTAARATSAEPKLVAAGF